MSAYEQRFCVAIEQTRGSIYGAHRAISLGSAHVNQLVQVDGLRANGCANTCAIRTVFFLCDEN